MGVKMTGIVLSMMLLGCSTVSKEMKELERFEEDVLDGSVKDCDGAQVLATRQARAICDAQNANNCELARGASSAIHEYCLDRMAQEHFSSHP